MDVLPARVSEQADPQLVSAFIEAYAVFMEGARDAMAHADPALTKYKELEVAVSSPEHQAIISVGRTSLVGAGLKSPRTPPTINAVVRRTDGMEIVDGHSVVELSLTRLPRRDRTVISTITGYAKPWWGLPESMGYSGTRDWLAAEEGRPLADTHEDQLALRLAIGTFTRIAKERVSVEISEPGEQLPSNLIKGTTAVRLAETLKPLAQQYKPRRRSEMLQTEVDPSRTISNIDIDTGWTTTITFFKASTLIVLSNSGTGHNKKIHLLCDQPKKFLSGKTVSWKIQDENFDSIYASRAERNEFTKLTLAAIAHGDFVESVSLDDLLRPTKELLKACRKLAPFLTMKESRLYDVSSLDPEIREFRNDKELVTDVEIQRNRGTFTVHFKSESRLMPLTIGEDVLKNWHDRPLGEVQKCYQLLLELEKQVSKPKK